MQIDTYGFELGDVVEDPIVGVRGTITAVHQYMTGCARVSIQPRIEKLGDKPPDTWGCDVTQLTLITAGPNHVVESPEVDRSIGGPREDPAPHFSDPRR